MAEEAEPVHHPEDQQGEKKENPFSVQPYPEQEEREPQAADVSSPPSEASADVDIVRAKLGVERFKAAYEAGDEEWKRLLTETDTGRELQAMYLGLKPILFVGNQHRQDLLRKNPHRNYGMYGSLTYDPDQAESAIAAHPEHFPDYAPGTMLVDTYLMHHVVPSGKPTPQQMIQTGLLCGFPRNAVEQFANHNDANTMLDQYLYTTEELPPDDETVLNGYVNGGSYEHPDSEEEYHTNVNRFRDEHQEEIRAFLDLRFPDLDEETKKYLLTARFVDLPGLAYASGNPTPEDKEFEQRVRNVFEVSGMNAYLASLKPNSSPTPSHE